MAIPIAILGGLIGLGGAEFRLPVLVGPLRYSPRQAVPLNLAVSIITIAAALVIRSRTLSFAPVTPYAPAILALITGAVIAAWAGTALFSRLSDARLERLILVLLLVVGVALIVEGFLPGGVPALLPESAAVWIVAGVLFGLGIGFVSSLLGRGRWGGHHPDPRLRLRRRHQDSRHRQSPDQSPHRRRRHCPLRPPARLRPERARADRGADGLGSVLGAVIGGLLVGSVPAALLKLGLGIILILSAWRTFRRR